MCHLDINNYKETGALSQTAAGSEMNQFFADMRFVRLVDQNSRALPDVLERHKCIKPQVFHLHLNFGLVLLQSKTSLNCFTKWHLLRSK